MKQNRLLSLTRLASSLSLFGVLLCMHITFTLAHFLPSDSKSVMYAVYIFYFSGVAAGVVLCPFFLPVPLGKQKPLFMGIGFIAFLVVLEFIMRSLGFQTWLGSSAVRGVMAFPEGILTTACYGLFYLAWLRRPATVHRVNRTGRFCSLVFGVILLGSVLVRYYSVPLLSARTAADPLDNAKAVFDFIRWFMLILTGLSSAASVFLTHTSAVASVVTSANAPANALADAEAKASVASNVKIPAVKTDLPIIIRLIGLASVFTILNALLDMRALPLYSERAVYHPNYLIVSAVVILLGFFAGRSTSSFIRRFTFPAVIGFILISCLPLFENYPKIDKVMSTLLSIAHYTAWVVFTTAVVELYSGGFWFYGASSVIFFSVAFAFLAPVIKPFVPNSVEYRVLYTAIASILFLLIAFRWLIFPKMPRPTILTRRKTFSASDFETTNLDEIFKQHELSKREVEVANLMIKEGLGRNEIGERLFISPGTVKNHITNIYQKFDVINRGEFMALFIKEEKI